MLAHEEQIAAVIDYADGGGGAAPIVVNCYAGGSRSPAAIMIIFAGLYTGRELEIVDGVRNVAAHIQPNSRVIAMGDRLLGADG